MRGDPTQWKEFVANRVALAHETLPKGRWHHVPGDENPADCASRGLSSQELATYQLCWSGPSWLSKPSPSWPDHVPLIDPQSDLEKRSLCAALIPLKPTLWQLVDRYSTLKRLLRITAQLRRVVNRFRQIEAPSTTSPLTAAELREAGQFWITHTQAKHYGKEIATLQNGRALTASHPLLRLTPFLDSYGLLRVGGRLRNALLDENAKHPIILPRDSPFTALVISDCHDKTLHGGVQLMLATLRQRFWIIGGRAPVHSYIRRCVKCARYRATAASELMGHLPSTRVTPSRPFLHSGVDYAGPFQLRTWRGRSGRTYKGFLIVFVCMATSAVHLDLAKDYSSEGFLAAYR